MCKKILTVGTGCVTIPSTCQRRGLFLRAIMTCGESVWRREAMGLHGLNLQGGAEMRVKIVLRCSECKQRNYNTFKNKKNTPDRIEMNKYCPFCRKHTVHSETK